jgi:hypothetical protein
MKAPFVTLIGVITTLASLAASDDYDVRSVTERVNAFFKQVQVRDYRAVETKLRAEYLTKRFQQERAMEDEHPEEMDGDPYTLSDGAWDIGAIEVKTVDIRGSRAEASVTRAGIDHRMKVSLAKENGKWMIDKIYFERRTEPDNPTVTPGAKAGTTTRLNLETSLPNGPSSSALESLLCDYLAHNSSYSPTQRSGVTEAYQNGLFVNEVRKAAITNEYTRTIDGEIFYIYDIDVAVVMKSTPSGKRLLSGAPPEIDQIFGKLVRETSLSVGIVKRGKKWYIRAAPN